MAVEDYDVFNEAVFIDIGVFTKANQVPGIFRRGPGFGLHGEVDFVAFVFQCPNDVDCGNEAIEMGNAGLRLGPIHDRRGKAGQNIVFKDGRDDLDRLSVVSVVFKEIGMGGFSKRHGSNPLVG
jgi:hypothetical protein